MEGAEVLEVLAARGMRPKAAWLESCIRELHLHANLPLEARAEKCFQQLLMADFNVVGASILPPNVHNMHKLELAGPFVLQVDEISNISCSTRDRYHERNAGVGRCLKLCMTDGTQRVFGIEYRPIPQLKVFSPAGMKIVISNVCVRRGLLLLVPEIVVVAGGVVEQMEMSRQRVVEHINLPPRGIRTQRGVAAASLAERLTAAAWPPTQQQNIPGATQMAEGDTIMQGSQQRASGAAEEHTIMQGSQQQPFYASASQDIHMEQQQQATPVRIHQIRNLSLSQERPSQHDQHTVHRQESTQPTRTHVDMHAVPFTYLALMQKRYLETGLTEAGRIKVVLTGVKEFYFRGQDVYRLIVYIDDGSLIVPVLMDHHLVQGLLGISPSEVSEALSKTNGEEYVQMKKKMREFQDYLANFEGYMDVEFNDTIKVHALEPLHSTDDTWLLLRRVETISS